MIAYKILGISILIVGLMLSVATYLRETRHERQKRRNRRFAAKCRNAYRDKFLIGQDEVNAWRNETKDTSRQNVTYKNPSVRTGEEIWKENEKNRTA